MEATSGSGDAEPVVEVKTVDFSAGYSADWRWELLSWSSALAAAGIVLLVVPLLRRGGRRDGRQAAGRDATAA
ncbi:unnamed protein product [uncultured bacterium]|nr:unnamed protein product [uncultured bacterium]